MEKIVEFMHRLIVIKSKSRNEKPLEKKFTLKSEKSKKHQREIKQEFKVSEFQTKIKQKIRYKNR